MELQCTSFFMYVSFLRRDILKKRERSGGRDFIIIFGGQNEICNKKDNISRNTVKLNSKSQFKFGFILFLWSLLVEYTIY